MSKISYGLDAVSAAYQAYGDKRPGAYSLARLDAVLAARDAAVEAIEVDLV